MHMPKHTLDRMADEFGKSAILRIVSLLALLSVVALGLDQLALALSH